MISDSKVDLGVGQNWAVWGAGCIFDGAAKGHHVPSHQGRTCKMNPGDVSC